ncbi:hypothetical protein CAPTEDRAFT_19651 [Capitella teleta]|uniref:guanylate cyclase n=1 Tax=Capitella teleta TaxID=283909 RepID=R7URU5_CAPTE|nr:hypothetical protein CAPTEDRAFT_19651 [Capitella teleta]|eukprot:ELU08873.1 hypothetical protein CAPTEDRAFT_19651 [Capitella teleta]
MSDIFQYGQIHLCVRSLVLEKFGEEKWRQITEKAGCDEIDDFMTFHHYGDDLTINLIAVVSEVLEVPLAVVLELFGEYFFTYCLQNGYDKMLRTLGDNIRTFIQNLDSLHALLAMTYKHIQAPSFRCESGDEDALILHYYSVRSGLYPIVIGVLRAVGRELYHQEIQMEPLEITDEAMGDHGHLSHVTFKITIKDSLESSVAPMHPKKGSIPNLSFCPHMSQDLLSERITIQPKTFCNIFPFHVLFDEDLVVKQCGANVARWSHSSLNNDTILRLSDLFVLNQPKMKLTYKHILKFCNATYILEAKTSDPFLQGQMIWLEDVDHILFIGSPRLASLNDMEERQLFLSDIPLYDVTRELVLLNQQRIAELQVSRKLDETTAELKRTGIALEKEKEKTDMLLYQMLPKKVANQLRDGISVDAEKFEEVTILFSDIVTFTNIAAAVQPLQIVQMLNDLYMRFDNLTELHQVYKVETIGDAYMVVGGIPEANTIHAMSVANFSIDMVAAASQVCSPATGKPLQIRVGVHTGSVVAGVVGQKMPRYCLFGDTVNTASRMESHGLPGKIHLSPTTTRALQDKGYKMDERGTIEIKGKGMMTTHFLISRDSGSDVTMPSLPAEEVKSIQIVSKKKKTPNSKLCVIS